MRSLFQTPWVALPVVLLWGVILAAAFARWEVRRRAMPPALRLAMQERRRNLRSTVNRGASWAMRIGGIAAAIGFVGVLLHLGGAPRARDIVLLEGGLLAMAAGGTMMLRQKYDYRAELKRRRWRVCPQCMYTLDGLPEEGQCPECGLNYDPQRLESEWKRLL